MRPTGSFATTSFAGTLLALMIVTGAAPSLSPIGRDVADSYRSVVRVYDRVRMWGAIARWWVDPESAPTVQRSEESEDVPRHVPLRSGRDEQDPLDSIRELHLLNHATLARDCVKAEFVGRMV
jgi:hypothetical protein